MPRRDNLHWGRTYRVPDETTNELVPASTPEPHAAFPSDPVEFARKCLNFHPDPRQTELLLSPARRGIVNCTRQWGKSTVLAIKALHVALTEHGSVIVVIAPALRQSIELLSRASAFIDTLNRPALLRRRSEKAIVLANGSRMLALPSAGHRIRGYTARLILIDEAAQVPDQVYMTLRPMLMVTKGGLWMASTPFGQRGFFYNEWSSDRPDWARFAIPAADCPRFDPADLERESAELPAAWFRQEFNCEFVDAQDALIPAGLFLRSLRDDLTPLDLPR